MPSPWLIDERRTYDHDGIRLKGKVLESSGTAQHDRADGTTLLLGLDVGGTKSAAILGDATGRVLARVSAPTPHAWQDHIALLFSLIRDVCCDYGALPPDAAGLGVSFGGPWNSTSGRTGRPPNMPWWDDVPLRDLLKSEINIQVAVENDANATALAEHLWGAGRGCNDMAYLTMGTGIGGGLILSGKLYRGRRDLAGEVGHAVVWPDGPECLCGKRGCLEAVASGTAIGRIGRERFGEPDIDAEVVCSRARAGDSTARAIVDEAGEWMGVGIANLLQTLNLERVVLGTMAVAAGDLLLPPIRESVQRHCWAEIWDGVTIVPAGLGEAAQDMAALAVATELTKTR